MAEDPGHVGVGPAPHQFSCSIEFGSQRRWLVQPDPDHHSRGQRFALADMLAHPAVDLDRLVRVVVIPAWVGPTSRLTEGPPRVSEQLRGADLLSGSDAMAEDLLGLVEPPEDPRDPES